ncbi:MAG: TRAP transporter small permease [Betaproteobacteria bacterium]|nr:TRAP transporter small permease [Betaproteobacteria bacterium]
MKRLLARIDADGERWMLLALYIYIVAVIFVEVVRRFVLSYSSVWGEETARYIFIYLVWIGAAAAVRDRAHIRIDVLLNFLPPRVCSAILLLGDVLMAFFAVIVFYLSMNAFMTSLQFGSVIEGLRISRAWMLFAVPFGFALVLLRVGQSIVHDVSDLLAGRPPRAGKRLFD